MTNRPGGVTFIGVLVLISAITQIIAGGLIILGGTGGMSLGRTLGDLEPLAIVLGGIILVVGIIVLILGIINIFVSIGLFKGKNWARIWIIVISILGLIFQIFALFFGAISAISAILITIIRIIIDLFIVIYLLSSRKAKAFFRR